MPLTTRFKSWVDTTESLRSQFARYRKKFSDNNQPKDEVARRSSGQMDLLVTRVDNIMLLVSNLTKEVQERDSNEDDYVIRIEDLARKLATITNEAYFLALSTAK